jgi:hypothetical protein
MILRRLDEQTTSGTRGLIADANRKIDTAQNFPEIASLHFETVSNRVGRIRRDACTANNP